VVPPWRVLPTVLALWHRTAVPEEQQVAAEAQVAGQAAPLQKGAVVALTVTPLPAVALRPAAALLSAVPLKPPETAPLWRRRRRLCWWWLRLQRRLGRCWRLRRRLLG